jgi:Uma2 family endonuclease
MEAHTMAPAPRLTVDDYFRTPETLRPTELIYGALRVADSPTPRHQQAVGAFHIALAGHVRPQRLGQVLLSPLDVVLDRDRALILQPDLLFVSSARLQIIRDKVFGAPDMVLEVLSPNPRIGKLDERIEWFAEYGVREIWLLSHLTERFQILRTESGRVVSDETYDYLTRIRSDAVPGFTRRVGEILDEG